MSDENPRSRAHKMRYEAAMRPLLDELADVGYHVHSMNELIRSGRRYRDAVPVLCAWLTRLAEPQWKEAVVRALSVPWAKAALPLLLSEFKSCRDASLRWALGNALEVLAEDSVCDDLIEIVEDREYGTARQMPVLALSKITDARTVPVLLGLLDDEEVVGHSISALGRLRAYEAKEPIARFTDDPNPWIRREAAQALKRIAATPSP